MTDNDEPIRRWLQQSMPAGDSELQRDLWPAMLRKLNEQSVVAVPWFDWALLALLAVCLCLVPRAIPVLLYHL